jgi:uncharacterized protein
MGPVKYLILQPTSFCNIDCDYCYLPNRDIKGRMPVDVVRAVHDRLTTSDYVADEVQLCFHVGEPLAAGIDWFDTALEILEQDAEGPPAFDFSIQTNGTLINDRWADLFIKYSVDVSVSLDGPDWMNDVHRIRRDGEGTHAAAMRGIDVLQRNEIPFSILCVLTADSLDHPEEMFEFFSSLRPDSVSFNIEEIEGINTSSSIASMRELRRCETFLTRFWELVASGERSFKVREFEQPDGLVAQRLHGRPVHNSLVKPFAYLAVGVDGSVSTFSPELLTIRHERIGGFIIGNVLHEDLEQMKMSTKLATLIEEIDAGVRSCAEHCEYFEFCGGGSPSNKLVELGTMSGTETWWCKTSIKMPLNLAVQRIRSRKRVQI